MKKSKNLESHWSTEIAIIKKQTEEEWTEIITETKNNKRKRNEVVGCGRRRAEGTIFLSDVAAARVICCYVENITASFFSLKNPC